MLGVSLDLPQMCSFSQSFRDVLSACLVFEPSQRCSARALNAMPFFSEKSQDSERFAVFKEHELESIDVRFARLTQAAPIPILNQIPSTPTFISRWDFGSGEEAGWGLQPASFAALSKSSFAQMSLSADLQEHRSHLENLNEALDTKSGEVCHATGMQPRCSVIAPHRCLRRTRPR